jgi:hypothetical protein
MHILLTHSAGKGYTLCDADLSGPALIKQTLVFPAHLSKDLLLCTKDPLELHLKSIKANAKTLIQSVNGVIMYTLCYKQTISQLC